MPRMTNIDIHVKLKDIKDGEAMGYCLADPEGDAERNDRPRVFELEIHKKLPLRKLLETICDNGVQTNILSTPSYLVISFIYGVSFA